jgi:hypothetical protein
MFVSCEHCVLSGRGLCDEPIPHPDESYHVWHFFLLMERFWLELRSIEHYNVLNSERLGESRNNS